MTNNRIVNETRCSKGINNIEAYLNCAKAMFEVRAKKVLIAESSFEDFVIHKTIGMGAFGRVLLVNHKSDNKTLLAMKVSGFFNVGCTNIKSYRFIR